MTGQTLILHVKHLAFRRFAQKYTTDTYYLYLFDSFQDDIFTMATANDTSMTLVSVLGASVSFFFCVPTGLGLLRGILLIRLRNEGFNYLCPPRIQI